MKNSTRPVGALLLGALLSCALSFANQGKSAAQREEAGREFFTDSVLVDQDGRDLRFYSDLIRNKVVIIIPFFTTCTTVCPPMNRNLQKIQDWLGDRLGRDVHMMSISVDPVFDTVPRLKQYSSRYRAKHGWYFLGGRKENVDRVLKRIGEYVELRDNHSTFMIVGNEPTGRWEKVPALANIADLIPAVESVLNDRGRSEE